MGRLILVRHGETAKNFGGSIHSTNDEEGLNETGKKQITETSKKLKEYSLFIVYFSTEKRAKESAEIISSNLNINAEELAGLQERNWGIFAGKSWEEIKKVLDPMTLEERFTYTPPQGESWKDFEGRLINAIIKITSVNKDKTIVVVTHGGAIRALMPYLLGVPREESFKYDPDNASLTIFDFNDGKFEKITVNDTTHLE